MMCSVLAVDADVVLGQVGGLPAQVRQRPGEVHGVLAGAAADLEDVAAVGEVLAQDGEDGAHAMSQPRAEHGRPHPPLAAPVCLIVDTWVHAHYS
jgi:hypothetical protein